MDSRFLNGVLSGVLSAAIQASLLAGPHGSRANWVIAAVSAYAFVLPGFLGYSSVALIASASLYAFSGFFVPSYAIFIALIALYGMRRFFPWQPLLGYAFAIFIATLVPYAAVDPRFIVLHPYLAAAEAASTAVLGLALHALLGRFYDAARRYPS